LTESGDEKQHYGQSEHTEAESILLTQHIRGIFGKSYSLMISNQVLF